MKNVTYINAGAGSGKTYRLTKILTDLIKSGKVKPDEVILTTFTTKAANEFKEKAKALLFDEGMYDAAVRLDHALIGTVHSVCQRMIGKYWFNLGLSPDMGVMSEDDTKYYISQSLADLPTDDELKSLHDFTDYYGVRKKEGNRQIIDYDIWQQHLLGVIEYATNYELDDFNKSEEESLNFIRGLYKGDADCSFDYEELKAVVDEHETFLRGCKQSSANDKRIKGLQTARYSLRRPTVKTLSDIESIINDLKSCGPLATAFKQKMTNFWSSSFVYEKQVGYIKLIFSLAARWREKYVQFKREKNLLDFSDMEKYMHDLLQNEEVVSEISQSYRYLFVDEFQDSSPIQVKIFDTLSDMMEHSYWVGDYKQAIYGFRGTDVELIKAVVDRISKKENGCDTETLTNSWRSLPDIVDVNNAVFEKTFAAVLDKENIHLEKVRENKGNEDSLRYFKSIKDKDSGKDIGVAEHIMKLLNDGAEPNQIAVLVRRNNSFDSIADGLKKWRIPSSKGDSHVKDSKVYSLVSSLLRIVDSDKDALSKATVAYLAENDYNTRRIIEEKILNDADEAAKSSDYLSEVPLISQLLKIRARMQHLSMASLVESVIVELNLYDVVKRIESDAVYGKSCLNSIISSARSYEDHCVQMNLPATVEGFLAYMDVFNPSCDGVPNGVQIHTYHSCKGLQWKYVILTSLNDNVEDKGDFVRKNIYGVSALHAESPTADNPFPEVYIRLLPWVFGAVNANVPDVILDNILADTGCMSEYQSMIAENNRILYVGMTRPSDVLMLNIEEPKKKGTLLKWPKDVGLETAAAGVPDSGDCDIFGTGHSFKNFTLTDSETAALKPFNNYDPALTMPLDISEPSFTKRDPRSLSPSKIRTKGEVESHRNLGNRIPLPSTNTEDMATVGNCIHQIFAGIEVDGHIGGIGPNEIIRSYGLDGKIVDSAAVVDAWKNLVAYLAENHGEAVEIFHERPFRLERDGQIFVGSIDLVWKTSAGDVLVDFKTCPMGPTAVLNPDSDHYAGGYAGQLDAYEDALTAAGEKVCARYIYYPVSALLAAVSRGRE